MKITYSLPTTNEDGTALKAADITRIDVYLAVGDGEFTAYAQDVTPQDGMVDVPTPTEPGTYRVALRAVNRWGEVSKLSEVVTKEVKAPVPNPPFGVALG